MSSSEFAQMVASGIKAPCCIGFWFELLNAGERFRSIMALLFFQSIRQTFIGTNVAEFGQRKLPMFKLKCSVVFGIPTVPFILISLVVFL